VITEIKINNFKSVQNLSLPLGRFNVLIGSNGSGKSNILEAITFAGAASADKLDNEFLGSRGIRTANSQLMKSAFSKKTFLEPIKLLFKNGKNEISLTIDEENKPILTWYAKEKRDLEKKFTNILLSFYGGDVEGITGFEKYDEEQKNNIRQISLQIKELLKGEDKGAIEEFIKSVFNFNSINEIYKEQFYNIELANFLIYSPEVSSLRMFEEESQIKPLGIKGEGLFSVLQIFHESYGKETIDELKKYLHIIEWFDDFEAIFDKVSGRKSLVVKDRYIPDILLNQNNVNEGFLFLMFYVSLFLSKETPSFFSIDNVEASFHPLLCKEMTKNLVELSETHSKQVILTTHNPFVLDGLDLNDSEQKLFVIRRDPDGETIADHIDKPLQNVKLSEGWMKGIIGGQPETIE